MNGKIAALCRVELEGEWFLERACELRALLVEKAAELPETTRELQVDMAKISDLDACCCQLLAVFLENLRRRGVTPLPCNLAPHVAEKIDVLGFSEAFAADAIRKESHDHASCGK